MKPIDHNLKPNPRHDQDDQPLRLVPDDPDETHHDHVPRPSRPATAHSHRVNENNNDAGATGVKIEDGSQPAKAPSASDPLQWAIDALHQPAMASADWLARDIDPAHPTAVDLLSNPSITLEQVRQAKAVFKTMRIVGEKAADRRVGARMYAAAIAAALVRFKRRISTQSDDALKRGFKGLLDDRRMPQPLRDLAGQALCILNDVGDRDIVQDQLTPRSKSA